MEEKIDMLLSKIGKLTKTIEKDKNREISEIEQEATEHIIYKLQKIKYELTDDVADEPDEYEFNFYDADYEYDITDSRDKKVVQVSTKIINSLIDKLNTTYENESDSESESPNSDHDEDSDDEPVAKRHKPDHYAHNFIM